MIGYLSNSWAYWPLLEQTEIADTSQPYAYWLRTDEDDLHPLNFGHGDGKAVRFG